MRQASRSLVTRNAGVGGIEPSTACSWCQDASEGATVQRWLINIATHDYLIATETLSPAQWSNRVRLLKPGGPRRVLGNRAFGLRPTKALRNRRDVEDVLNTETGLRELSTGELACPDCYWSSWPDRRIVPTPLRIRLRPIADGSLLRGTPRPNWSRQQHCPLTLSMCWVIVNCCHAGQLRGLLYFLLKDLPADRQRLLTLCVLSTGRFDEKPRVVEFTRSYSAGSTISCAPRPVSLATCSPKP